MKVSKFDFMLLLGPVILFAMGFCLNFTVMVSNHNQMPVFVPGGECSPEIFGDRDIVHSCMTPKTHLKFLADIVWFNDESADASIGDLLIEGFEYTFWPCLILFIYRSFERRKVY